MSIRKKPTSERREKAENKGFEPTSGDFENKIRFSLWLKPQTMEEIDEDFNYIKRIVYEYSRMV